MWDVPLRRSLFVRELETNHSLLETVYVKVEGFREEDVRVEHGEQ